MQGIAELFSEFDVLGAFFMTIKLSLGGAALALILGTIVACMRVSPIGVFRTFATGWVGLFMNSPLTLVVFFCYAGFYQMLRVTLISPDAFQAEHAFVWGVVALGLYHSAFVAENIRSGVNTVPLGQAEAARAVGLDFSQSLREVILPQAFRGAIAPLGNTLIALTKNTTVVATIGVAEASYLMKNMIEFNPQLLFVIFLVMATGFVVLTLPLGLWITHLSQRMAVQR